MSYMTRTSKRLALHKLTIRTLTPAQLGRAAAGLSAPPADPPSNTACPPSEPGVPSGSPNPGSPLPDPGLPSTH
jgi:hypothetical protein